METENTAVENEIVDVATESAVEQTPVETSAPSGREAVEAAFDKVVANSDKKTVDEPVKGEPTTDTPTAEEATDDNSVPTKGLDPSGRGPNSWKASVREMFGTLPAEVKNEVLRREADHQKLMTETTALRRFGEEFAQAYRPYEAMLQSSGVSPVAAFKDLMNTVYTLRTADPVTKGQMVANIIKTNNVDLASIDNALAGIQPQVDPHTAAIQQELAQLKQWRQQQETQHQTQLNQSVEQQIQTFANDPKNEFFHDVVGDMQMLLNSGRVETLDDAYAMACRLNPEVSGVIQSRSARPVAPPVQAAPAMTAQQKVAASSGVKGAPTTSRPPAPKQALTGKEAALAAWDRLERKSRT